MPVTESASGLLGVTSMSRTLSSKSATLSEEEATIEEVYEPYLMQLGLLARTPKGRVLTPGGYKHLNIKPKQGLGL